MKFIKKKINELYNQAYKHNTCIQQLKQELEIQPRTKNRFSFIKTKKSLIVVTSSLVCIALVIVLGITLYNNNLSSNEIIVKNSIITMELNPSISISVDDEGIVIAAYGNNDEGKMILSGEFENIINKKYDEALNIILEIQTECGYFVKNTINEEYNNLKITIDCEKIANNVAQMEAKIKEDITTKLHELNVDISNKITVIKNTTKDALVERTLAIDPNLSKEDANKLSIDQLLAHISAYYLETNEFPTTEFEQMYNKFKNYELDIAETRIFKELINTSSTIDQFLIDQYNFLYDSSIQTLNSLQQYYIESFIDTDSQYQKTYSEILILKADVLKLRQEVESLTEGFEKTMKLADLKLKENALQTAESTLTYVKANAEQNINLFAKSLTATLDSLKEYIESNVDLNTLMYQKADQISNKLNEEKANFVNNFESNYQDEITNAFNKLKEQKQQLITQLKQHSTNE